jgi:hypothetical protein
MSFHLALMLSGLLLAQPGEVLYSNGQITFARYSLIDYPLLLRAAGMECEVKTDITIDAHSNVAVGEMALQNGRSPSHLEVPSSLFFKPVREAVLSWALVNEMGGRTLLSFISRIQVVRRERGRSGCEESGGAGARAAQDTRDSAKAVCHALTQPPNCCSGSALALLTSIVWWWGRADR